MLALTLMTASNPVFLMRECLRSSSNRSPSLVVCERRREEGGREGGREEGREKGAEGGREREMAHKKTQSIKKEEVGRKI